MVQTVGKACATALGQDCAWCVGGTARRPLWLEQREQGGEGAGEGAGRAGPCGLVGRTWGFTLGQVGALKDCEQRRGGA